jgi:hypothetical protein
MRTSGRVAAAAAFGAAASAAFLVLAYARHPGIALEMDRDPPSLTTGFYPAERDRDLTFAWTSRRAAVTLAGADRRGAWSCSVVFRGARPPQFPQPDLEVAIDGVTLATRHATNDFQTVGLTAPGNSSAPGLRLTLTSSTTFVPGPGDSRALGVQVDRVACRPDGALAWPPRRALGRAAVAGALWGTALGFAAANVPTVLAMAALVAAGQSFALARGAAPYGAYADAMVRFAAGIAIVTIAAIALVEWRARRPPGGAARFAVAFSAAVLYLRLIGLVHPSKAVVDAVFHAHRLEWVLSGRYYFTQLSTSATPFPYAIGLYLFAAPWTMLTRDHVTLLRVVVCGVDALAGLLLYPLIVRAWNDRVSAAVAVVLASLVPISYIVIGNANLTNAFGQSMALLTVIAATAWTLGLRRPVEWVGLALLATLALVSHVSTFALLLPTLVALTALTWLRGGADARDVARSIAAATGAALVLSVALYWGHFGQVYLEQLGRLRADTSTAAGPSPGSAAPAADVRDATDVPPALGKTTIPLTGRVRSALSQTAANVGWPVLALAAIGAWRLWVDRRRDRLMMAVLAWAAVGTLFVLFSVLTAVDRRYQQDAWEFIGRVEHATYPAAVIAAAYGVGWTWRAGVVARAIGAALLIGAGVIAAAAWVGWV